jgi:hypothetical protein
MRIAPTSGELDLQSVPDLGSVSGTVVNAFAVSS